MLWSPVAGRILGNYNIGYNIYNYIYIFLKSPHIFEISPCFWLESGIAPPPRKKIPSANPADRSSDVRHINCVILYNSVRQSVWVCSTLYNSVKTFYVCSTLYNSVRTIVRQSVSVCSTLYNSVRTIVWQSVCSLCVYCVVHCTTTTVSGPLSDNLCM
jgi:hypothetical protein